jgi:hypothetical protein
MTLLQEMKRASAELANCAAKHSKLYRNSVRATAAYCESVSEEVSALLRKLDWRNSWNRDRIEAKVSRRSKIVKILRTIKEHNQHLSSATFRGAYITLRLREQRLDGVGDYVEMSKSDARSLGIERECDRIAREERKLARLVRDKGITPDILRQMIKAGRKSGLIPKTKRGK